MSSDSNRSEVRAGVSYKTILLFAFVITALCSYALIATASETGNWKGAYISLFHVLFLTSVCLIALKK